jgi:hypothetical protein
MGFGVNNEAHEEQEETSEAMRATHFCHTRLNQV